MEQAKYLGRAKIFTSAREITRDNVREVLKDALTTHEKNQGAIQFLIDYERGKQPLPRAKTIRSEINIESNSALPNYIKRFKMGYNWGSPVMLIQRGNVEVPERDARRDDQGISLLNEQLTNIENIGYLDSVMAEFIEVGGIGHRMVDIKTADEIRNGDGSLFNIYTLDSRYAFVVYYDGPGQRKVLGVTYNDKSEGREAHYTCYTDNARYEIEGGKIVDEGVNLLGMIPIVEYERAVDRTGCFERMIPQIDELNVLESDFANDSAQRTQEIWWGNDIDFPADENGKLRAPVSGQWLLTHSTENASNQKVQALSSTFPQSAVLSAVTAQRTKILQDCFVPIQYESSGGGSTGTATDMAAGWSAAELDACLEQQMTTRGKREELKLILRVLRLVPEHILAADSPLRDIKVSDVDFHFNRKRNYDLTNKANFVSQMLAKGFNGRHVLAVADVFPDNEQAWLDSKEMVEAIQKSGIAETSDGTEGRLQADNSDQTGNSPILDGMQA